MLLRHKKAQGEEQNWCVILSAITSEFEKKRVAEKISHVFSLSSEESLDLVSNTPIIVLDNLTRSIALKLRDFLKSSGAQTTLTNDTFQKRKCYRTVWPEQPSLSFLHHWSPEENGVPESEEMLAPEQAVNEIRGNEEISFKETAPETVLPKIHEQPVVETNARALQETQRWRQECLRLREEVRMLQGRLESFERSRSAQPSQRDDKWVDEKEKEIRQAQVLLEHANEKYDVLRQEYANARQLYEQKITALLQETERSKRKIAELTENLSGFQKERHSVESSQVQVLQNKKVLEDKLVAAMQASEQSKKTAVELTENLRKALQEKQVLQSLAEESRKARVWAEEKLEASSHVLEQFKRQMAELSENFKNLQSQKQTMEVTLAQNHQESEKFRAQSAQYLKEIQAFQLQIQEFAQKNQELQKHKDSFELTVNTQSEQIAYWHMQHSKLVPQFEEVVKKLQDENLVRENLELRGKEFEKNQIKLIQELQSKNQGLEDLQAKYQALDSEFRTLNEIFQKQEASLQSQMKLLETRDRELEAARRQIRDVNAQIEQRDAAQKRNQLAQTVADKEALLKKIVSDQQKIETEIKDREAAIRSILTQQEAIEKEIIEAKQAQRHMTELAKRDQKTRFKIGSPQELGSEAAETTPDS